MLAAFRGLRIKKYKTMKVSNTPIPVSAVLGLSIAMLMPTNVYASMKMMGCRG
jgi:hypothetical protein